MIKDLLTKLKQYERKEKQLYERRRGLNLEHSRVIKDLEKINADIEILQNKITKLQVELDSRGYFPKYR